MRKIIKVKPVTNVVAGRSNISRAIYQYGSRFYILNKNAPNAIEIKGRKYTEVISFKNHDGEVWCIS